MEILEEICIRCGRCEKICPTSAISKTGRLYIINEDKCIECGDCEDICPVSAIDDEDDY